MYIAEQLKYAAMEQKQYFEAVQIGIGELPESGKEYFCLPQNKSYLFEDGHFWGFYARAPKFKVFPTHYCRPVNLSDLIKEEAGKAWDAADKFAEEQSQYPYGKRTPFEHPNKEQYISALPGSELTYTP